MMEVFGPVEQSFKTAALVFNSLSSCQAMTMPLLLDIVMELVLQSGYEKKTAKMA